VPVLQQQIVRLRHAWKAEQQADEKFY